MEASLQTRKPIDALTTGDLDAFMIWEQDATCVRPLDRSTIPVDASSLSVAADFVTADGTRFAGIVGLSTDGGLKIASGGVLAEGAYVYAGHGEKTSIRYKTSAASELGKAPADIYPLRFTLRALLDGESAPRSGMFA
jgi:hypothetical protein